MPANKSQSCHSRPSPDAVRSGWCHCSNRTTRPLGAALHIRLRTGACGHCPVSRTESWRCEWGHPRQFPHNWRHSACIRPPLKRCWSPDKQRISCCRRSPPAQYAARTDGSWLMLAAIRSSGPTRTLLSSYRIRVCSRPTRGRSPGGGFMSSLRWNTVQPPPSVSMSQNPYVGVWEKPSPGWRRWMPVVDQAGSSLQSRGKVVCNSRSSLTASSAIWLAVSLAALSSRDRSFWDMSVTAVSWDCRLSICVCWLSSCVCWVSIVVNKVSIMVSSLLKWESNCARVYWTSSTFGSILRTFSYSRNISDRDKFLPCGMYNAETLTRTHITASRWMVKWLRCPASILRDRRKAQVGGRSRLTVLEARWQNAAQYQPHNTAGATAVPALTAPPWSGAPIQLPARRLNLLPGCRPGLHLCRLMNVVINCVDSWLVKSNLTRVELHLGWVNTATNNWHLTSNFNQRHTEVFS